MWKAKSEIQELLIVDINIIHLSYRDYLKVKQTVQSWDQRTTVDLEKHRGVEVLKPW